MQVRFLLGAVHVNVGLNLEDGEKIMKNGLYDIHCHILPHVDDGSNSTAMSKDMLRIAYENGIRHIVLTPHYMIGRFEAPRKEVYEKYQLFLARVEEEFPEMHFYFGREIFFGEEVPELLQEDIISTINNTDYVLVEFHPSATASYILESMYKVQQAGYIPILAHIERYPELMGKMKMIEQLVESGVYVQVNASSVAGNFGKGVQRQLLKMMKKGLVHFVATDAHSNRTRGPYLEACLKVMKKKLGVAYIKRLLIDNPRKMLHNKDIY